MSKTHPNKFRASLGVRTCNTLSYAWQFGDGSGAGTGQSEEARHRYAQRGPYRVDARARCDYSTCSGPGNREFNHSIEIFARDDDWIEYRERLAECGWTADCWRETTSSELLGSVLNTLEATTIDWLVDAKQWSDDHLNRLGQVGGLTDAQIATMAVIYATSQAVFITSALDLTPQGKALKALKKAAQKGATRADEIMPMAEQVVDVAGETTEVLFRWQKLERKAVGEMAAERNAIARYFPTRGRNNGFDRAVVWRDPQGVLQVTIGESKAWSASRRVVARDLSAFGLRNAPDTINLNVNQLILSLNQARPPGVTDAELAILISKIRARDFDVIFHGLPDTQFDEAGIRAALLGLGITRAGFRRTDV